MKIAPIFAVAGAGLGLFAVQLLTPKPKAAAPAAFPQELPAAPAIEPAPSAQTANIKADASEPAVSSEDAQAAQIKAGLAYLDAIRAIPGAAPLVDDIVAYLKDDAGAHFSVEGLATDANGLALVDESANRQMIKDPAIRAKWEKLMTLIAANGDK